MLGFLARRCSRSRSSPTRPGHATSLIAPDRKGLVLKSLPDGACVYLDENNLCRLNPVKPDKCRSFPFEWTNPDSNSVCPELAGQDKKRHRFHRGASAADLV